MVTFSVGSLLHVKGGKISEISETHSLPRHTRENGISYIDEMKRDSQFHLENMLDIPREIT